MGKKNCKRRKLYCFFSQWSYCHKGVNAHILQLKKSLDELCEILKKCPIKKK